MVASLLKIVSTGMQDERLQPPKGQPNLDSFLMVIIKAGRYATNWTRIDFDTKPEFGARSVIRVPSKGEMIGRVYLVTVMPDIRSQQQVAYYTRKPIRLANSNYTSINMYDNNGKYLESVTITYQPTTQSYGLANFAGSQIDDLIVGGVYTLSYTIPQGTFALLVTNKALNTPQFNILNTDTFMIIGGVFADPGFLLSSYNGSQFQTVSPPLNISSGTINGLAYNTKYVSVGTSQASSKQIIIENSTQAITLSGSGYTYKIAYNGSASNDAKYIAVGNWQLGSMRWSTDGLTWSDATYPQGVIEGSGYSVAWIASLNQWIAVGSWGLGGVAGIISRSSDGKVWNAPTFISTAAQVSGPIAQTSIVAFSTSYIEWFTKVTRY